MQKRSPVRGLFLHDIHCRLTEGSSLSAISFQMVYTI